MFSVIIPVYNSEQTILKTVSSILLNLVDKKDEIIIVNDGSTDNTINILDVYKENKKIKIINQNNKGVSAARNHGIEYISDSTKFVTFIDDSDQISNNFFNENIKFFTKHENISVAVNPIMIIENNNEREHNLNFRFKKSNDVVNILEDKNFIHYHMGGTVFRKTVFTEDNYRFDEKINYWEDAKLFNILVINKQKYGLVKRTKYYYNRDNRFSLSKLAWLSNKRYEYHIDNNFFHIINESIMRYGYVIPYVQFLISNHYLEYLLEYNQEIIKYHNINITKSFYLSSEILFTHIENNVIENIGVNNKYKHFLFKLKNIEYNIVPRSENIKVYIHSYNILNGFAILSFSKDSFGISTSAIVSLLDKKALIVKNKNAQIFNEYKEDFSLLVFKVKVPIRHIIFGFKIDIKDVKNNKSYLIHRPSIIKKFLKI
ncbi:glycosyltransferase family 2 protein [Staphylococcus xylosus]|uniref:glycosyltransferase family 2 protein n=1 Tax=Staphylococcus xylosus TaxID=1288 RepID=UPI000853E83B|nr:glycosyltransferase family 2 protein [Staphylococcus xylosus]MCA2501196.1 glycosyltransferase family 2 protein [Staphylococcus xylosus]MCA2501401.1 glycosyltransferase family 2 protein [Staphylococcus xylosus]MCE7780982.1 glycosyltransferase [Staphylococcus xylosus]OEK87049.1 hypothetical protein AST17_04815 [Staphylococcus xylosus]